MPTDNTLAVRKAVVSHLISDEGVTSRLSSDRIYGEASPAEPKWPFARLDIITTPFEATRWDGSSHRITVNTFFKENAPNNIHQANRDIVRAMQELHVPDMGIVDIQWAGTQVIRDGDEASAWHGINQFDLTVAD